MLLSCVIPHFISDRFKHLWYSHLEVQSEAKHVVKDGDSNVESEIIRAKLSIHPCTGNTTLPEDLFKTSYHDLLTEDERREIIDQFDKSILIPGGQVFWTGIPREWAQRWAEERGLQTLTSAMGPLLDPKHISCRKHYKGHVEWRQYVKGASALFAAYLPRGYRVTVLSRPPPERFNPTGKSTYQRLEEPILKGLCGRRPVLQIEVVHLTVVGTEDSRYQIWPTDELEFWIRKASAKMVLHKNLAAIISALRTKHFVGLNFSHERQDVVNCPRINAGPHPFANTCDTLGKNPLPKLCEAQPGKAPGVSSVPQKATPIKQQASMISMSATRVKKTTAKKIKPQVMEVRKKPSIKAGMIQAKRKDTKEEEKTKRTTGKSKQSKKERKRVPG